MWSMNVTMGVAVFSMRLSTMVMRVVTVCAVFMVVRMSMTLRVSVAAVRTTFRLKRFLHGDHRHVHGTQHVGQHMIGFDL